MRGKLLTHQCLSISQHRRQYYCLFALALVIFLRLPNWPWFTPLHGRAAFLQGRWYAELTCRHDVPKRQMGEHAALQHALTLV